MGPVHHDLQRFTALLVPPLDPATSHAVNRDLQIVPSPCPEKERKGIAFRSIPTNSTSNGPAKDPPNSRRNRPTPTLLELEHIGFTTSEQALDPSVSTGTTGKRRESSRNGFTLIVGRIREALFYM